MQVKDKVVAITGAASGIGRALAQRFKQEGAKGIVIADVQEQPLQTLASELSALAVPCDVSKEDDIKQLVQQAENTYGPIDVFCSNAGIAWLGDEHASDADWQTNWNVHVMAHVYAARAVAQSMAERNGYFILTGFCSRVVNAYRFSNLCCYQTWYSRLCRVLGD